MQIYQTRCQIIRLTREFFWSQGFTETDTPIALKTPSQEPYLSFFPITVNHPQGGEHRLFLRTSPEFSLKKLLAAGFTKIFEIGKNFRNIEDFGGTHNPEFTMIEWYRAPGSYTDFMDDMENLFQFVGAALGVKTLEYKEHRIRISEPWERLTMKQVWQNFLNINLDENLTLETLSATASAKGYNVTKDDEYEDVFFKIFLNEIEPKLGLERPLFIYDYPAVMTSLSRPCPQDARYAERVECYIGGLEMCNGFGELTDAAQQNINLERDKALRHKLGKETWPVDPDFISALRSGIEPPAGVALGVDRMVLLFTKAGDINEVIFGSMNDQLN